MVWLKNAAQAMFKDYLFFQAVPGCAVPVQSLVKVLQERVVSKSVPDLTTLMLYLSMPFNPQRLLISYWRQAKARIY